MPPKIQTPESKQVAIRFVRACDKLIYLGMVRSKREFCREIGIPTASNLLRMSDPNSAYEPSIAHLLILVKKYNVSLKWLMLGEGEFME